MIDRVLNWHRWECIVRNSEIIILRAHHVGIIVSVSTAYAQMLFNSRLIWRVIIIVVFIFINCSRGTKSI